MFGFDHNKRPHWWIEVGQMFSYPVSLNLFIMTQRNAHWEPHGKCKFLPKLFAFAVTVIVSITMQEYFKIFSKNIFIRITNHNWYHYWQQEAIVGWEFKDDFIVSGEQTCVEGVTAGVLPLCEHSKYLKQEEGISHLDDKETTWYVNSYFFSCCCLNVFLYSFHLQGMEE